MEVMSRYRIERDSLGEVAVPAHAYYGAQTQRAVLNFPLSGQPMPAEIVHALGLIKWAAASVNLQLGRFAQLKVRPLSDREVEAIRQAAWEVYEGKWDDHFPVDIYQTGSGTSTNMNANEVIANRASELLGFDLAAEQKPIHPNDHVNLGQSSNDVFPTALHIAVAISISRDLIPVLEKAAKILYRRSQEWSDIIKIGRTHLNDATAMTLGQEVSGWARAMELASARAGKAVEALRELPIGGTAVGTGINTHPEFGCRVAALIAEKTGLPFVEAANHFEANSQRDGLVEASGQLRAVAVSVFHVVNNIRWLSSGPRCGFNEISLPKLQPGSSIMPGKVNPVLCESLMQIAARAIGNDSTVAFCGAVGGQFQLNVLMPVMGACLLENIRLLANGLRVFCERYLELMTANKDVCQANVEKSLALATALTPWVGYEKAAALAQEAFARGLTIRELSREKKILPEDELDRALDPWRMIRPESS
ncbi:MAG: class II fumarate hydratase [Thermoguttaceae bacterium]|nr:class II fumarate hydratase [Thermoguttaceae bacterium]MDW8077684.1 class II fumarate hydratase [Thermoguttaceae bacterium]